jgi:pimeloyl-ACP methyl ester carboxylesterase
MAKTKLRDLIVVLPGITGSVLQKDGKDLWAISGEALWTALTKMGKSVDLLKLPEDDPPLEELKRRLAQNERALEDLGDGITAPRLVEDFHGVLGLGKIDGYSKVIQRLKDRFEVTPGGIFDPGPANFFEFPYDWRHDNRVAALRLQLLVERHLPRWREAKGAGDAKVILIGHSMGGLVARYYLEALGGWPYCRALITFGTPYRGSVNAVSYLANGYKQLFMDLTEVMRSMPSVYQLLPIYKMLKTGGQYQRVAETAGVPGVVPERAARALAFHREIEHGVNAHRNDPGYAIVPVVGFRQSTLQSAELQGGTLTVSQEIPAWIDARLGDGDGTVPRLSAIPIELSEDYRDTYFPERHGSLQNNENVLDDLCERITQMQVSGLGEVKVLEPAIKAEEPPGIGLEVEDLYLPHEPVTIRASLVSKRPLSDPLRARIEPLGKPGEAFEADFQAISTGWELTIPDCPAGAYRLEVRPPVMGPGVPSPVHDVFEVAGQ